MSHLETWLSNGTYTAAAICCSSAASTPAKFCCSSPVKLSAVSLRLTNTDSTWPLCCMPAGTAAEFLVILHGYGHTAWIRSYCMDTVILHGYGHTAWIRSYCMDTVILHGYGHIAGIEPARRTWLQFAACLQVQQQGLAWYMGQSSC